MASYVSHMVTMSAPSVRVLTDGSWKNPCRCPDNVLVCQLVCVCAVLAGVSALLPVCPGEVGGLKRSAISLHHGLCGCHYYGIMRCHRR